MEELWKALRRRRAWEESQRATTPRPAHQHSACPPSPQRRRERQRRWLARLVKHAGARFLCLLDTRAPSYPALQPATLLALLLPTLLPLRLRDTAPAISLLLPPGRCFSLLAVPSCCACLPLSSPRRCQHRVLYCVLCFASLLCSPSTTSPRPPPCPPGLTLAAADEVPRSHSTAVATLHRPSTRRYGAIGPRS